MNWVRSLWRKLAGWWGRFVAAADKRDNKPAKKSCVGVQKCHLTGTSECPQNQVCDECPPERTPGDGPAACDDECGRESPCDSKLRHAQAAAARVRLACPPPSGSGTMPPLCGAVRKAYVFALADLQKTDPDIFQEVADGKLTVDQATAKAKRRREEQANRRDDLQRVTDADGNAITLFGAPVYVDPNAPPAPTYTYGPPIYNPPEPEPPGSPPSSGSDCGCSDPAPGASGDTGGGGDF